MRLNRLGDEIVVAGQLFHTGTRVVLWMDQFGYDAYRVEPRFSDLPAPTSAPASAPSASAPASAPIVSTAPASSQAAKPKPAAKIPEGARYGSFRKHVPADTLAAIKRDGWSLPELQQNVDLFVMHYDVCGTSRQCFKILQDVRGLSVQFMLDVDGTIYQTLDLKERAWHASEYNDRSIGVEIANIGAYFVKTDGLPPELLNELGALKRPTVMSDLRYRNLELPQTLDDWYDTDGLGRPFVRFPAWMKETGIRNVDFTARPARRSPVVGRIHGKLMAQYDFTNEQYRALAKLVATVCTVLPEIKLEFPREADGLVAARELSAAELADFHGIVGHYHLTKQKQDPGPAFDWERLKREATIQLRGW